MSDRTPQKRKPGLTHQQRTLRTQRIIITIFSIIIILSWIITLIAK
jgi:hypothetical protein